MVQRRWLTREEIDEVVDEALDRRFKAWEDRMAPTLEALRDGAQSALMTNMLLVGDTRFATKGFIQETRERYEALEKHSNAILERQGFLMRAVDWLTHKDESGDVRYHRLMVAGAAVGGAATYTIAHIPVWYQMVMKIILAVKK